MMTTALRKSASRPPASVSRASPSACNSRSKNDASAFSTSSSSSTLNGCSRTLAVSKPSLPKTPPTSLRTATASAYSLMSNRVRRSFEPKRNSATALAISVFPTPVGPMNRSDAMGRFGRVRPAFTVARRSVTSATASG